MLRNKIASFLLVAFFIFSLAPSVLAMSEEDRKNFMKMSEEERKFLLMYFDEDELFVVSTTRSLKSITRIAENVEFVTAADIELMNAHTLADVLNTVNGVVVMFGGASPGSIAGASIQGSTIEHVVVMIDGISISPVSDWADLPVIPAQIIEKVEKADLHVDYMKGEEAQKYMDQEFALVADIIKKGGIPKEGK